MLLRAAPASGNIPCISMLGNTSLILIRFLKEIHCKTKSSVVHERFKVHFCVSRFIPSKSDFSSKSLQNQQIWQISVWSRWIVFWSRFSASIICVKTKNKKKLETIVVVVLMSFQKKIPSYKLYTKSCFERNRCCFHFPLPPVRTSEIVIQGGR